ncbi:MAG: hypothetical protein HOE90_02105 [Bacteriovoracaceae bacterium]|nr:hypothetical protein [Bacteriovoracaceae bacterium]
MREFNKQKLLCAWLVVFTTSIAFAEDPAIVTSIATTETSSSEHLASPLLTPNIYSFFSEDMCFKFFVGPYYSAFISVCEAYRDEQGRKHYPVEVVPVEEAIPSESETEVDCPRNIVSDKKNIKSFLRKLYLCQDDIENLIPNGVDHSISQDTIDELKGIPQELVAESWPSIMLSTIESSLRQHNAPGVDCAACINTELVELDIEAGDLVASVESLVGELKSKATDEDIILDLGSFATFSAVGPEFARNDLTSFLSNKGLQAGIGLPLAMGYGFYFYTSDQFYWETSIELWGKKDFCSGGQYICLEQLINDPEGQYSTQILRGFEEYFNTNGYSDPIGLSRDILEKIKSRDFGASYKETEQSIQLIKDLFLEGFLIPDYIAEKISEKLEEYREELQLDDPGKNKTDPITEYFLKVAEENLVDEAQREGFIGRIPERVDRMLFGLVTGNQSKEEMETIDLIFKDNPEGLAHMKDALSISYAEISDDYPELEKKAAEKARSFMKKSDLMDHMCRDENPEFVSLSSVTRANVIMEEMEQYAKKHKKEIPEFTEEEVSFFEKRMDHSEFDQKVERRTLKECRLQLSDKTDLTGTLSLILGVSNSSDSGEFTLGLPRRIFQKLEFTKPRYSLSVGSFMHNEVPMIGLFGTQVEDLSSAFGGSTSFTTERLHLSAEFEKGNIPDCSAAAEDYLCGVYIGESLYLKLSPFGGDSLILSAAVEDRQFDEGRSGSASGALTVQNENEGILPHIQFTSGANLSGHATSYGIGQEGTIDASISSRFGIDEAVIVGGSHQLSIEVNTWAGYHPFNTVVDFSGRDVYVEYGGGVLLKLERRNED